MVKIGILGIQGSREEHEKMLKKAGAKVIWVLKVEDLEKIQGLIIPGGESTAIGKALKREGLFEPLLAKIQQGLPVWGTCAGAILLANEGSPYSLQVIDIAVERNAYGRQTDSFEQEVNLVFDPKKPFKSVCIRAPRIKKIGKNVKILATINDEPAFVQEKNVLASTFHPELTSDKRVHQYFVNICKK